MKLGTTGLVLDALEQGCLRNPPVLHMPVQALREVSRDLECKRRYLLQDGTRATAAQIQRWYWQACAEALDDLPANDDRQHILRLWAEALEDFEIDPARLNDRIDWCVKRQFFEQEIFPLLNTSWDEICAWSWIIASTSHVDSPPPTVDAREWLEFRISRFEFSAIRDAMNQSRLNWSDYPRQRKNYYALRALDVRFHDLDRHHGLFYRRPTRDSLQGITAQAIEVARREPPRRTRAWLRGRILRSSGRRSVASLDWDRIYLTNGRTISLPDPFASRTAEVDELFHLSPMSKASHGIRRTKYLGRS